MNRVYRTLKLVVKSACRYNDSIRDHDRNNFGIIRTSITYEITENWNSKKIRISWFRQLGCKLCYIQMCSWAKISYSKRAFSFSKTKTSRLHEICKIFRCVPLSHTPFTKKTKIWQNWFFWIFVPLFNYVNPAFEFFIKSNNFIGLFGLLVFILYSFNTQHQLVVAVWPSRSFKFYERQRGDIRVTIEL